jgi:hypothetical protein
MDWLKMSQNRITFNPSTVSKSSLCIRHSQAFGDYYCILRTRLHGPGRCVYDMRMEEDG